MADIKLFNIKGNVKLYYYQMALLKRADPYSK